MNKKKKKYKLNRNAPKAQEGIATVGEWAEHVWDGIVDTIQNINLNAPQIDFGGGKNKGGEGSGGESTSGNDEYVPSNKTDYTNLSQSDLEQMHGKYYDFGSLSNLLQNNPRHRRGATGRRFDFASLYHTPENVNFDFDIQKSNQKSGREQGFKVGDQITNKHSHNISAILMDVLQQDPEAIEILKRNSYQKAPRADAVTNLSKKHGLDGNLIIGDNRRFLKDIDQDKLAREQKKFDKQKAGKGYKNYSGHLSDVALMNELLGPYLPKGFVIDSQIADFANEFLSDGMFTDAAAAMHPDIFDPGVKGGGIDKDGKYSAFRTRRDPSADFDKFINAPQNYIYNLEASGMDPDDRPSQEWLHLQHLSNQGANEGMGGYNKQEIAQMLMQDKGFLSKNALDRSDISKISELRNWGVFHEGERPDVFNFGVRWDDKNQKWFSEGTNDWLTDKQAAALEKNITQKYMDESGWQQFNPQLNIEPVTIGHIPSVKTDEGQMPTPGGPLGFTDTSDDLEADINEFNQDNQGVDVSGGTEGEGGAEGGGAEGGGGRGRNRQRRSMDAILDSVTSGTHVVTGENYNESDLKRDSAIIKREFGDEAYNTLLKELMSVDTVEPGSEETVVNETATGEGGIPKRRNLSADFVADDDDSLWNRNQGDEDEMSLGEWIRRIREDDWEEEELEEDNADKDKSEDSISQVGRGFAGDSGLGESEGGSGGGYSPFPDQMSPEEMQRMMAKGETPIYKHGGFGKGFDINKMKFNQGGKPINSGGGVDLSQVAKAFSGGQGVGGFNLAPIYNTAAKDPIQAGDTYLSMKIMRLEKELSQLDPNVDQEAMAALQLEIDESKAELIAVRGGGVGASRG
tara:strand:- start:5030 stop:7597 length:2568 start_codon:yes stop_codon:yes gene_type:complete